MSIEVVCKLCGEEYDMKHGKCPACRWRIKRVAQLEAENEGLLELLRRLKELVESEHVKVMAEDLPFQIGLGDLFQDMDKALEAGGE